MGLVGTEMADSQMPSGLWAMQMMMGAVDERRGQVW